MNSPFISKVRIKNFRNFIDEEVVLTHKQVIIGENNVGKTNFIRALQLILDPQLSDVDRSLQESDFNESLDDPMGNGEEIEIAIEIQGYEHNRNVLAELRDATVSESPHTLRLTYKYYPVPKPDGTNTYQFIIFQGLDENQWFSSQHRKYLNIKVIKALRDVEAEMKNSKRSPLLQLLRQYEIEKEELDNIAESIKENSDLLLQIDEVNDLERRINKRFDDIVKIDKSTEIKLATIDVNTQRLLNIIKTMVGQERFRRPISESSLGLNNILYITLMLLLIEDKTIPKVMKRTVYEELLTKERSEIINRCYEINANGKYILRDDLAVDVLSNLYNFLDLHNPPLRGFTFLAIEEPEAHLHPTLQRILYQDVMRGSTSILLTTHSTHITSVAPVDSIVHLLRTTTGTKIKATAEVQISLKEKRDIERYIDIKRGELYFGKGIILVEGIAEEYLIPSFAEKMNASLDSKGVIVCNINSTNFKPYIKFLDALGIPYVIVTDGDYYINTTNDKNEVVRQYHLGKESTHTSYGYLGYELAFETLVEIGKLAERGIPVSPELQKEKLEEFGIYAGEYTLEIEIMRACLGNAELKEVITDIYNELTLGKETQKRNFANELDNNEYWKCLAKIEGKGVGKGRFAQRLSVMCSEAHVPVFVANAITAILSKVEVDEN
ncbi:AAA family ATPase [Paenibacillus sp. LMG 31459]|uniref:AAA family ATPase n=1 Tax=Paenibacillus phytohabitans TaxID=2654978 RepID=A0ABX1YSJ5_9BACL|nr:AAA family ATPase [Paenibacillus phytohabitans]NOU83902.1 AAA family ATPase [Paenibacillus phytohabitans]